MGTRSVNPIGRDARGEAGAAAAYAEGEKVKKYSHLDHGYFFQPVALETTGAVGSDSMSILKELGHRIRMATERASVFCVLDAEAFSGCSNRERRFSAGYTGVFRFE